jgi:hypothetical protein
MTDAAHLIAFPQKPEDRLRVALRSLEAALDEQAEAVRTFRASLAELADAVGGLETGLGEYAELLGGLATDSAAAHAVATDALRRAEQIGA